MTADEQKKLVKDALQVQDAVNLRGVLLAWHKAACAIGTDWRHPVNVLYLAKVSSLMALKTDGIGGVHTGSFADENYEDLFHKAYSWAVDYTREPPVPDAVIESVHRWARTPELFQEKLKALRYHAGDNFWSFTVAGMFVGVEPDGYMHT